MKIERFIVGQLEANCYLISDGKEAVVIDPGDDPDTIMAAVEKNDYNLTKILLTHGHFDHIGAMCDIAQITGAEVYVHSEDALMLTDNSKNLSFMGEEIKPRPADKFLKDGDTLTVGREIIKVYHTPGHSDGSVCFQMGDHLFTGDLLFKESIGRFDHGNMRTELASLKFLMDNMDDCIMVYPGHGPFTTIGEERRFNPYIVNHVL